MSLDDGVESPRIRLPQHGVAVEPQLPRERLQLGVAELFLVCEHEIPHLPELALLPGILCAGRRDGCARVSGKREVLEAEAHLGGERAHQLAQRLRRRGAVRALVIGVLDDGDGRLRLTELGTVLIEQLLPLLLREARVVPLDHLDGRRRRQPFEKQRLDQFGHPWRVLVGDVRGEAARQRVVAAGVSERVAGDLEELRALLIGQGMQVGAREDLARAFF